ncbi:hypothetical protein [Sutcliffiella horikoshii]|uniref:hypothetical protein n=1 Tax=Sutcliffiella horikoshii TaxID=79883 RepID=UPI003CF503B9
MDKVQSLQEINRLLSQAEKIQQLEATKPRVSLKGMTDNEGKLTEQYYKLFPQPGERKYLGCMGSIFIFVVTLCLFLLFYPDQVSHLLVYYMVGVIAMYALPIFGYLMIGSYNDKVKERTDAEYKNKKYEYIKEQQEKYRELYNKEWDNIQKRFNENQGKLIAQIRREMQRTGYINHTYHQVGILRTLKSYLETGRADSLKEALNLFHFEKNHQQQKQYMHDTMQEMEDRYTEQMEDVEWQFQNANEAFERKVSGMEDEIDRLKRRER